jgi:hypothetical protein
VENVSAAYPKAKLAVTEDYVHNLICSCLRLTLIYSMSLLFLFRNCHVGIVGVLLVSLLPDACTSPSIT